MTTVLDNYLVLGAILFALGALGFITRRNLIVIMLSAELMLHGVSLNLVAFAYQHGNYEGQAFTIFILTVAACEAGLALALVLALYQRRKSLDINMWRELGEPLPEPPPAERPLTADELPEPEPEFPRLTPAGRMPDVSTQGKPQQEIAGRV